jgi:hypothetical protein
MTGQETRRWLTPITNGSPPQPATKWTGVIADGGGGGIGSPSQLDRDVDSGQLQDHG